MSSTDLIIVWNCRSPNVPGQIIMGLMCNPPRPGDESYAQFMREKDELLQSLKYVILYIYYML
jgi:hypothetical protein